MHGLGRWTSSAAHFATYFLTAIEKEKTQTVVIFIYERFAEIPKRTTIRIRLV